MEDVEERDVMDMEDNDEAMDDIQEPLLMKRTKSNNLHHKNFEEEKMPEPTASQTCKLNIPVFNGHSLIGPKQFAKAFDYQEQMK